MPDETRNDAERVLAVVDEDLETFRREAKRATADGFQTAAEALANAATDLAKRRRTYMLLVSRGQARPSDLLEFAAAVAVYRMDRIRLRDKATSDAQIAALERGLTAVNTVVARLGPFTPIRAAWAIEADAKRRCRHA